MPVRSDGTYRIGKKPRSPARTVTLPRVIVVMQSPAKPVPKVDVVAEILVELDASRTTKFLTPHIRSELKAAQEKRKPKCSLEQKLRLVELVEVLEKRTGGVSG